MNEAAIALDVLELALKASAGIAGLVTDEERRTLEERIARARAAIKDPIDVSPEDAARKERLERAIRGEG